MSRSTITFLFLAGVVALLHGTALGPQAAEAQDATSPEEAASAYVVDLAALDYAFAMPLEIPSGWITFQMENRGQEEHLALVAELPDSLSLEQVQELVRDGEWEGLWNDWAAGVGILSPGLTAHTAVYLEPGIHIMLCTIETPEGESHAANGMVLAFEVTEEAARSEKPETDIQITVSNYAYTTDQPISAGTHTFDVVFADPGLKDVFVTRLKEDQTPGDIVQWLHTIQAPSPFEFLGGTEQKPGVFMVTLEPGRYAFVSHQGMEAGLTEEIVIPEGGAAPIISNEPVNPPLVISVPGGKELGTVPPGRTLVTLENMGDSESFYYILRLKPEITEDDFREFALHPAPWDSEPETWPDHVVAGITLNAGERVQLNLELRKGSYLVFEGIEEHLQGDRALTSPELEAIQKIEVR